jgi:FtsH-binding integral membrane protein
MASEKRERQRANREAKQAEVQKVQKRTETLSRAKRIAIWAVLGIVLFIIANLVFGGSNDDSALSAVLALAMWAV